MNSHTDYILLSQQKVLENALEISANNLSNLSTPGYQSDKPVFMEMVKNNLSYVEDRLTTRDHKPGPIQQTGDPLHMAIQGPGYFMAEKSDGSKIYTRSGLFTLNKERQIVLPTGEPALNSSQNTITLPENVGTLTVGADGTISDNTGVLGTIGVFSFKDENGKQNDPTVRDLKTGHLTTDQEPIRAEDSHVMQFAYENSNVDPILETVAQIQMNTRYTQNITLLKKRHDLQSQKQDSLLKISTYA